MAKNQHNTVHISQAIQELLKVQHLKPKFDEASVVASWERIVGKAIAKRTKRVFVRNKVLFVELQSPSMKQDLGYHKSQMLELFTKEFGEGVVSEIVFM
jgi:predicted nucleic acid-binding Zn ribbon protein